MRPVPRGALAPSAARGPLAPPHHAETTKEDKITGQNVMSDLHVTVVLNPAQAHSRLHLHMVQDQITAAGLHEILDHLTTMGLSICNMVASIKIPLSIHRDAVNVMMKLKRLRDLEAVAPWQRLAEGVARPSIPTSRILHRRQIVRLLLAHRTGIIVMPHRSTIARRRRHQILLASIPRG
jgi:hypothetical protein